MSRFAAARAGVPLAERAGARRPAASGTPAPRDGAGRPRPAVEERFGPYGGRFVPEVLIAALDELTARLGRGARRRGVPRRARRRCCATSSAARRRSTSPSASPSGSAGRVYLKREDLAHTGAHKINNAVGQALLARRMGKAPDHRRDRRRPARRRHGHRLRAARARVRRLHGHRGHAPPGARTSSGCGCSGAEVAPVEAGARTLKEAVSAAIRDWVTNVADTHYIIGSAVGPGPLPGARPRPAAGDRRRGARAGARRGGSPAGARDRLRRRRLERDRHLRPPSSTTTTVELIGVEAAGEGIDSGRHGASLVAGRTGVLHGALSSVLADEDGQILEAHSVSAGLDYPGVGPEHAHLRDTRPGPLRRGHRRRRPARLPRARPARGDHPGARAEPRDRLAAGRTAARRRRPATTSSDPQRARATRTWPRSSRGLGAGSMAESRPAGRADRRRLRRRARARAGRR